MGYIKNIPHESILRLAEQVSIQPAGCQQNAGTE